jgi:hypothetical protein
MHPEEKFLGGFPAMSQIDDQIIADTYSDLNSLHRCSVDDILVDPMLREQYIERLRERVGDQSERQSLKHLLNLRKRGRLPRGTNASRSPAS